MSSTPGAGPNDPSAPQPPSTREGAGESALGYGDIDPHGSIQGAGALDAAGEHADSRDAFNDQQPQPVDASLIAGGENLVGAANHVTTGPDTMGADLSDEEDDSERTDHRRPEIGNDSPTGA